MWKSAIIFMSIHPFFCMQQLGSLWKDSHEILFLSIFRKSIKAVQFVLKSDENYWCCTWKPMFIYIISHWILVRIKNVTDSFINPLNAELNPIRHLLALVGARHIVHVSRIRVNAVIRYPNLFCFRINFKKEP
jgi:hypothetical protein